MCTITRGIFCGMLAVALAAGSAARAQGPGTSTVEAGGSQAALRSVAEAGKFAFIVFYREDNPSVKAMADIVTAGVQRRSDKAAAVFVPILNPAEASLVQRYEVSRAPMPLTLAIAPNGAVTGIFSKQISDEKMDEAIVTPTMTRCMKSLQDNRLVFVCVQTSERAVMPNAVKEMQSDPHFKDRMAVVSMHLRDPNEARFVNQMQINPLTTNGVTTVLLAPPGVLIGKFDAAATGAQVAASLHRAGKCCDDVNCKHNHGQSQPSAQPNASRRK